MSLLTILVFNSEQLGSGQMLVIFSSIAAGRPDWSQVLPEIVDNMKNSKGSTLSDIIRPKVYACGPAALCKDLRQHCSKLKISFKEEVFN